MLLIHENRWKGAFSSKALGKGQTVKELWKGPGANRHKPDLLAEIYNSQMQAEVYQDQTIFDQNEKNETQNTVSCIDSLFLSFSNSCLFISKNVSLQTEWTRRGLMYSQTKVHGKLTNNISEH